MTQAYGRYHTILDNCQIVTSFAATDVETADTVSKLAGDLYEMRPQETWSGKRQLFGLDHRAITYREERRPLLLPAQVRQLPEREELIFVTGARPLKAKKLRYDEEPVFASRLYPLPERQARAALPSPWSSMRSLGLRAAAPRTAQEEAPGRDGAAARAVLRHSPLRSRPRPAEQQADLLALIDSPTTPRAREDSTPPPPPPAEPPSRDRVGFDLRPRDGGEHGAPEAET